MVGDRVEQRLVDQRGATAIARHQRYSGGQVATSTVAANGEATGVAAEAGGVGGNPAGGGVAVLGSGREAGFGRQAVVDRDDQALAGVG